MDKILEFTSNHVLLVSGLMISFFVLVFSELRRKASGLINLQPTDAVALINKDAMVLDIRNAEAFSRGHIVNAKNLPADEFAARRDAVLGSKTKPIVAVCDNGITTNRIVGELRKSGFENAFGLKGGMTAWSAAGLPVVTGKKTKSKK